MRAAKSRRLADSIRDRINASEWAEGALMPNERALSRDYGVARNTIRRALLTLVEEGLLVRHVGRGTMIAHRPDTEATDLLKTVHLLMQITPLDLMNMRMILEPQIGAAAALAAGRTEQEALLAAMQATEGKGAADPDALDRAFHAAVARATRNELLGNLQEILNTLDASHNRRGPDRKTDLGARARIQRQHHEIAEGILAREPERAAEAIKQHLSTRASNLLTGGASPRLDLPSATAPAPQAKDMDLEARLMGVMERISGTSPLDIMQVRTMIEPQVAAVAAANARTTDIELIMEAHQAASRCVDMEQFEKWDGILHKRIFESTRNDFLTVLHDVLYVIRTRDRWMRAKRRTFTEDRRARYCVEHQELCDAIHFRNTEAAAAAMKRHMVSVGTFLFGG
ncbi:MAG: FadR family transcriptional regulator [Pararhodobacter sp.]|nr:FadR family transcriptional regulator [Pararhodobacter sp.]